MTIDNEILTPVGRLVMGDCFKPRPTDAEGRPLVIKNGPNAGQPREEFFIGLAIPKTAPEYPQLYQKILDVAKVSFPNMFDAQGNCTNPKFAFKIIDGDSTVPNSKGKRPCDRIGFAGHWIMNFANGYAPRCYDTSENLLTDTKAIRRGYYIRVYATVGSNRSEQQPGVYLNHSMIQLAGYGEEIITGPDAGKVFGSKPLGALPAGASATPVAPATTLSTQEPSSATPPPPPPAAEVAPARDFLNPVAEPSYKVGENVFTAAQLLGVGYTAEQIETLPRA